MSLFHWILLRLPPEWAHELAKAFLRLRQWIYVRLLRRKYSPKAAIHIPAFAPLRFPGRWGIAAGLDKNAEFFASLAWMGAGFVEVGTVVPLAQAGNPKPRLWRPAPGTLINHMGFNSEGLGVFKKNILEYRSVVKGLPLFANIGKNRETPMEMALDDYRRCFEYLQDCVDGFVVNISSPNTPGLVDLQSEAFATSIAGLAPKGMPVLIKLSPDLDNRKLSAIAACVKGEPRLAGIVVTNTSREMAEEVFGKDRGGLSGRPLFSRALECVQVVRDGIGSDKAVIGVGGIWNAQSARQMRDAGADLVEVYTGLVYRGASLMHELSQLE